MPFELNTSEKPKPEELQMLFTQTSWASRRQIMDIEKMLENLNVFVTIRDKEELVGFGRALTDGIYRALLDDIIIDSTYRNQGLGKLIVEKLLEQLETIDEIFLVTKPDLEEFYTGFGFKIPHTITMKK